ncbi:MAG TPA: hypothetical protein VGG39_27555 [Polyangiaceae bacterium]|jgi:hypothetical protein
MQSTFLRVGAAFALLASVFLSAPAARADDAVGNDEVTLKDGGSLRGTVVASEPGTSVTILELGQKEPRVVPWAEVSGVERGKFAPVPAADGKTLVPGTPGVVKLHVESPVPVGVYKHRDSYGTTARGNAIALDTPRLVCNSPCDTLLDGRLDREFSVVGDQANESDRFRLVGLTGTQDLVVAPGSPSLRSGGVLGLVLGLPAIGLGGLGAIAGAIGTSPRKDGKGFVQNVGLEKAGFITLGSGVVALVAGIIAIDASGTSLELHPEAATAERKPRYWAGEF